MFNQRDKDQVKNVNRASVASGIIMVRKRTEYRQGFELEKYGLESNSEMSYRRCDNHGAHVCAV